MLGFRFHADSCHSRHPVNSEMCCWHAPEAAKAALAEALCSEIGADEMHAVLCWVIDWDGAVLHQVLHLLTGGAHHCGPGL